MKKLIFACLLGIMNVVEAAAPTVNFSVSPTSGNNQVDPTITWSSSGAVSCSASSTDPKWNGAIALSGSKVVGPITVSTYYYITCTSASDLSATLNWTAPTQNTDGSQLTDLKSFKIYEVQTSPVLLTTVNSIVTSAYISGLSIGTHTYYVTAVNSAGAESSASNSGSKTTYAAASTTKSAYVSVTKKKK